MPSVQPLAVVKKGRGRPPGSKKKVILAQPPWPSVATSCTAPHAAPSLQSRKYTKAAGIKAVYKRAGKQKHAAVVGVMQPPTAVRDNNSINNNNGLLIESYLNEIKAVTKSNGITRAYNSHVEAYNAKGFPLRAESIATIQGAEQLTSVLLAEKHLVDDPPPLDHNGAYVQRSFAPLHLSINGQASSSSSSSSSSSNKYSMTCGELWKAIDSQAIMAPLSATSAHPFELLDECAAMLGEEYNDLLTVTPDVNNPLLADPSGGLRDAPGVGTGGDSFFYNRVVACILSNSSSPKRKRDKTKDTSGEINNNSSSSTSTSSQMVDYGNINFDGGTSDQGRGGPCLVDLGTSAADSDFIADLASLRAPDQASLRAHTCVELFEAGFIRPTDAALHENGAFGKTHWMFNMEESARARQADDEVSAGLRRRVAELRRVHGDNSMRLLKLKSTIMQREHMEEGEAQWRREEEERAALERYAAYVKRTAERSRRQEEEIMLQKQM